MSEEEQQCPPQIGFRANVMTPAECEQSYNCKKYIDNIGGLKRVNGANDLVGLSYSASELNNSQCNVDYSNENNPPIGMPMPMPMPMPMSVPFVPSQKCGWILLEEPEETSANLDTPSQTITPVCNEENDQHSDSHISKLSSHCWQRCASGVAFPENAVRCGQDSDGTTIYIGRAFHNGEIIPAKVMPDKDVAYIAYGGEEVAKQDYEVLRTGTFVWEFATNGEVPYGAVEIGRTCDGEKLFMGRCIYEGSQTPGKIQVTHGCLYIPYGGEEVRITEYEVLVLK